MCTYTAAEITQTAEQIAFGDSRRSEHAVVAFDHIVQAQNLLAIADAHFQAAFDLFIIFRHNRACISPPRHLIAAAASTPSGAPPLPIYICTPVPSMPALTIGLTSPSVSTEYVLRHANLIHNTIVTFTVQQYDGQVRTLRSKALATRSRFSLTGASNIDAAFSSRTEQRSYPYTCQEHAAGSLSVRWQ